MKTELPNATPTTARTGRTGAGNRSDDRGLSTSRQPVKRWANMAHRTREDRALATNDDILQLEERRDTEVRILGQFLSWQSTPLAAK